MTGEVAIREMLESDWPILFEYQHDPVSSAMAGVPAREWDAYVALQQKIRADATGLKWTILYDGQIAGDIMSFLQDGQREVGYRVGREYWGKGIATRALALRTQHMRADAMVTPLARRRPWQVARQGATLDHGYA
jgi:RimJ/RimL family protein N-acetyltransferase